MNQLRKAAARERRAPILWWLVLMMVTGGGLVVMVYSHTPLGAILLGILLIAAWVVPMVAFLSLSAPARAKVPPPGPGEGTFAEWLNHARLLGRVLLYYEDNPGLSTDLRRSMHAARVDLRDTLRAHPLRDDLERVCQRIREGALKDAKNWFGRDYRPDLRELANAYEQAAAAKMDPDQRLLALQAAVEKSAAMMTQVCMPRMLERERLACATNCAWLAVQAACEPNMHVSPVDLAEMLVIEWSDFSEPWQPARALRHALARLNAAPAAPGEAAPELPAVPAAGGPKLRRIRVRVRVGRSHRRHRHHRHYGKSILDIFLSFGQWVRYSLRAWMLYR